MDSDIKLKLRKIILIYASLAGVVFVIFFAWQYLTKGKIIITTDDKEATILLERLSDNGTGSEEIATQVGGGELSARLSPGTYRAKVGKKILSVGKIIHLKARQSVKHNLNSPEIKSAEPVASVSASNIYASESSLFYLSQGGVLNRLDEKGPANISSNVVFAEISWGKNGFGVGRDLKGGMYSIDQGRTKKLPLPGSAEKSSAVSFAVSKDNQLYISVASDVYLRNSSGTYQKIYTTSIQAPRLSASNNNLAVYHPPDIGAGHEEGEESSADQPAIEVIKKDGSLVARKDISAFSVEWSPDGQKLIAADLFGKTEIYDSSLNWLALLPGSGIQNSAWADDSSVLYSTDSLLWLYRISEDVASVAAFLPAGSSIADIKIDAAFSYAYISGAIAEKSTLQRLPLKNQLVSEDIRQIYAYLPVDLGGCKINYLNFIKPTILVSAGTGVRPQSCIVAAKEELESKDLRPQSFRYIFYVPAD